MSAGALAGLKAYWESLAPETLADLGTVYAPGVRFRDPFNDVRGLEALRRILERMFESLDAPRFRITETLLEEGRAVLVWDFTYRVKRWKPEVTRTIHGLTLVRFAADGRVEEHRDYWDAAGELYAQLPVVGGLMRLLARRLG